MGFGLLKKVIPNLFRWGLISRWLIALCFWAISMQQIHPLLNPWPILGIVNTLVIVLCLLVLGIRLVARFSPEKPIWLALKPLLHIGDVTALIFITCGVTIYLNGELEGAPPQTLQADVIQVSEEPIRLGRWWPAGWIKVALRDAASSEQYLHVDEARFQTVLPGESVSMWVYKGAFGVPWVELKSLRPDAQATVRSLVERGAKDSLLKKWLASNELVGGRFKPALKFAKDYFEQEPTDYYFAMTVAGYAVRNGNPALAVQMIEPFVYRYYNYNLYCNFAGFLVSNQDPIRGMDYMKAAAGIDPDQSEAYHLLGHAYKKSGQEAESMAAFKRLVQLQPQYAYLIK